MIKNRRKKENMKRMQPKKLVANALKWFLIAIVAAFTGLLSYQFWQWTFPPERWYFAVLGFGLTGGGSIVYLVMFLWDENTPLRNTISLGMMVISILGEIVTAGYGITVESWTRANIVPTEQDFDFMTKAVQVLLLFHFAALVVYFAGDKIAELFADADGDGIPNYRDRDYQKPKGQNRVQIPHNQNRTNFQSTPRPVPQNASSGQKTNFSITDLERVTGMGISQIVGQYPEKKAFKGFVANQFDYIDGENLHRLWTAADPTSAATVSNNGRR